MGLVFRREKMLTRQANRTENFRVTLDSAGYSARLLNLFSVMQLELNINAISPVQHMYELTQALYSESR